MNLQEIRTAVRAQLDVDEEELPDTLVDMYVREGYDRMISVETRWPFFESSWTVSNLVDTSYIVLPVDLQPANIHSLIDPEGWPLHQISPELAESRMAGHPVSGDRPPYFSVWSGRIELWPRGSASRDYTLRGYRTQRDWVSEGASAEVDADPRMHILCVHYAIALAYAQQEDEVLEDVYMKRWTSHLGVLRVAIMEPGGQRPPIFNGGMTAGVPQQHVIWDLSGV